MSDNNTILPANNLFLLTLKGQVTIHFLDGETVTGEITAQDQLNIFALVKGEPLLIPRRQVRFIKGQAGQQVERDDSHRRFAEAQPRRPEEKTVEGMPTATTPPGIEEDDDDMTFLLDSEEEPEDMTVFLDAEDDEDETAFITEDDEDQTAFFSQEEDDDDATLFVDEEASPVITAYLECTTGPHAGERFELQSGVTSIGRSSDNIFALSKDKETSRRHALITHEGGKFFIEDRGSLNGVIVNDVRADASRQLQSGDTILLGISTLVFHDQ